MSDWKTRATPVTDQAPAASDWRSRATPAAAPAPEQDPHDALNEIASKPLLERLQSLPQAAYQAVRAAPGDAMKAFGGQLDAAGRVMDYPAGLARTAVGGAFGLTDLEDLKKALQGKAPRTQELMDRGGVPEGPSVNLPLAGKVSARDAAGFAGDVATDPMTYLSGGANHVMGGAVEDAGTQVYKTGLKRVDEEVAKYGKEPVSDLLMKNRVWGSADSVAKQMDGLATTRLEGRNEILDAAGDWGAQTDVHRSLENAKEFVANLKAQGDRRLDPLIAKMEGEIETLSQSAGRPAIPAQPEIRMSKLQPELTELPLSVNQAPLDPNTRVLREAQFTPNPEVKGYSAPSEKVVADIPSGQGQGKYMYGPNGADGRPLPGPTTPVVNNPVDSVVSLPVSGTHTENVYRPAPYEVGQVNPEVVLQEATPRQPAVPGPTPRQMSGMKTNSYSVVGDQGYNEAKTTPLWKQFEKSVASGQKGEVERSVAERLGPEQGEKLAQYNDELGRLLTSQERAERDAAMENHKNTITSIDGMLAGAHAWPALIWKKVADFAKLTSAHTGGGLLLQDFGRTRAPDVLARRSFIDQTSPWTQIKGDKQ